MKLYYSPGACSLSPHIVLREAGQKFDLIKVDLATKKTETGDDYLAINPRGAVPALQMDNGEVLTEGAAIVQYIADKADATALVPKAGTTERYKQLQWLNFVASELHKSMGALFNDKMATQAGDVIKGKIVKDLSFLNSHLGKQQYLAGSSFTAADAYAFTILGWGQHVGVDVDKHANVKAYMGRIGARPKVQEALKAEGLV